MLVPRHKDDMNLKYVPIRSIHLNEQNPRLIKDENFKKLVKSIQEFPKMLELRPIIVDEKGEILAGNQRYRACIELGMKEVPVIKAEDLTEEQKQEFIVKDNIHAGEFDYNLLSAFYDHEQLTDWGLNVFNDADFEVIKDLSEIEKPEAEKEDKGTCPECGKSL